MIFAGGKLLPDTELPVLLSRLEEEINAARSTLTLEPETVISAIEALTRQLDSGELNALLAQFATPKMLAALEDIRPSLTREALELKLKTELGSVPPSVSPSGCQLPPTGGAKQGRADEITPKIYPLGTLFHVTAGNVAGLPAFSAVEGLLTGNVNLIKLPRGDKGLTLAILSKLVEQEPRLAPFLYAFDIPSSDQKTMQALADLADGLVVWGGDEAVRACRAMAPVGCKLMEWGHRLSFAYVAGFEDKQSELSALAKHIVETGGLLCSSCQVIFLDTGDMGQAEEFCGEFLPLLEAVSNLPQPIGQTGQRALYAYEAYLEHIVDHPQRDVKFFQGKGCSVTLCGDGELELSPLNANVLVKCLPREKLLSTLRREKGHLQTAGLLCAPDDRPELTDLLCRAGITRITRAGSMSATFPGENHDGEYSLRRYIRIVDIET